MDCVTIEDLKQLFDEEIVLKKKKPQIKTNKQVDLNLDRMRKETIQKAMAKQKQRTKISQELGISIPTLNKYLKQYELC